MLLAGGLGAQEAAPDSSKQTSADEKKTTGGTAVSGTDGLIAVRDARTGRLRAATAEERRELLRGVAADRTVQRGSTLGPYGMRKIVVAPTHLKAFVATRAEDGSLKFGHVSTEEELEAFAEGQAKEERRDR